MDIIKDIKNQEVIEFSQLITYIDSHYYFSENEFKNGDIINKKGENNGSNKVFAFAALQDFDKEQTLHCFGEHYQEVLKNPDGDSHQNIRNFMHYGWQGIIQEDNVLREK